MEAKLAKKLSKKEIKFCELYAENRDYTYTKLMLGYDININRKKYLKFINAIPAKKDSFEVSDNFLLRKIYAIATFDHSQMYDKDGDIKPLKLLTTEQKMALKSYKELTDGNVNYAVHDSQRALEIVMKHRGMLEPVKKEDDDKDNGINITFNGLEAKQDNT